MRVIVTKTIDHGEKVYNLVFSNSCKKEWVYRVSENINIEDLEYLKKYVSYDIEIPRMLYIGHLNMVTVKVIY